jgi:16S rRNA (cytidine1402-2'-O)-methyltransferase
MDVDGGSKREHNAGAAPLAPALYLVATPIGTAADITLRALDILRRADVLAAEDTRRTRQLLEIHGVPLAGRPLVPYHDHNGAAQRPVLLGHLAEGRSVALVSDAGTPLVADPGYRLVQEAIAAGLPVTAVPGASAVLAALSLAGLPTDRFLFAGFPPPKAGERARWLAELAAVPATLVLYESPHRVAATLADALTAFGDRPAALCRELTKRFEEVRRGRLGAVAEFYGREPDPRGEIVLVIGPPEAQKADALSLDAALRAALAEQSLRDASREVADAYGAPRKEVYRRAVAIRDAMDRDGEGSD